MLPETVWKREIVGMSSQMVGQITHAHVGELCIILPHRSGEPEMWLLPEGSLTKMRRDYPMYV
jgi:hypothetical protein